MTNCDWHVGPNWSNQEFFQWLPIHNPKGTQFINLCIVYASELACEQVCLGYGKLMVREKRSQQYWCQMQMITQSLKSETGTKKKKEMLFC